MKEEGQLQGQHELQSLFIKKLYSDSWQDVKNKNLFKDETPCCLNESDRKIEFNTLSEREIQDSKNQQAGGFKTEQQIVIESSVDSNYYSQKSIQNHPTTQRVRNKSRYMNQDQQSQKNDNAEQYSFNQMPPRQQFLQDSGNVFLQFKKNQQNNKESLKLLKKKLVLTTKLKIRMSNFYKQLTNIMRNRSYNKTTRLLINDLSDELLYMRVKQFYFVQLVSLTLKLFLIAHVIACFWYLLGLVEIRYLGLDKTWFSDSIGEDLTWWKLYLASMYWTLTLMITGSNISLTVLQTFYTTFIMLFTCIVFGYILSVIGLILAEIEKKQENQNKDIRTINEYMNQKNISNNLKASVNQNLLHYHQKNFQQQQIENNEVLCKISSELKDQLLKEYNMRILERIPILYKNFSQQTLNEISLCLKEEYFFPNSIIQFENDIQNQSLMIIIEGQVEVNSYPSFPNKQQAGVTLLNSGDVFGHLSFLTGLASQIKTKSTDFTKIMRLDRSDLLNILKKNDAEYQKFCEIKDKILLYSRYSEGGLKCQLCESSTHLIYNCSHINLNKNGMLTKLRIFEQENQNRKQFKRKSQYNQTPLALIKYQKGIIKNLQFQLECESFFSHQSQSENSSSESSQNEQQDEIVSFKQYNQKRQSEVFKMESDLNTVQLFDRINNNFRYSAQLTKLDSRENEEILMLDSKKIQKVDSQNENQGSNLNNQINISQSSNGACISNLNVQINSPEVEQKNAIQTNKINSYLSNFLPRRQSIAKKIPECNESKTNYSNQISLEKRRQGINDFFLKIFEKGQLYQQTIAMNAIKNNDTLQQSLEYNEWLFDSLRDFEFYFNYNNSKYILNKLSKVKIKKIKQQKKVKADLKEKIK